MQPESSRVLIPRRLQFLQGAAMGLTQTTALGLADINESSSFPLTALDRAFDQFGFESAPAHAFDGSGPVTLLRRLAHGIGAIQRLHKIPVSSRFHVRRTQRGSVVLALPYVDANVTLAVIDWMNLAVGNLLQQGRFISHTELPDGHFPEELVNLLKRFSEKGINSFRFFRAADQMNIQVLRQIPGVFLLGTGRHARMLASSTFDSTSALGVRIARNKFRTASVLRQAGLPAPTHAIAKDALHALEIAGKIGYPVVVKPVDCDRGDGVAANLGEPHEVQLAFACARKFSSHILVERHFEGIDHRLTVFNGRVVQVVSRRPGGVEGDGVHTLAELVSLAQQQPESRRRMRDFGKPLLALDEEALSLMEAVGLHARSVVPKDQFVGLRRRANISAGGTPVSVPLQNVHPDNMALAVHAAQALKLDMAGVDLLIPDIRKSWLVCKALICEVNAEPQISQTGRPQVYADILRELLGPRHNVAIWLCITASPLALPIVAGPHPSGLRVGQSSPSGLWMDHVRFSGPQPSGFGAARALLVNTNVDMAIVCMSAQELMKFGLPCMCCESVFVHQSAEPALVEVVARLADHVIGDIVVRSRDAARFLPVLPPGRRTLSAEPLALLTKKLRELKP